jgi:capsular polysaccharide biosynthesis protein
VAALKNVKSKAKAYLIALVNRLPFSSLVIGSPRKSVLMNELLSYAEGFGYSLMIPETSIEEAPPLTIYPVVYYEFFPLYNRLQPTSYVIELPNGRVWGNKGAIITQRDEFISDLSMEFGEAKLDRSKHSIFNRLRLRKPERFHGAIAVISSPGMDVYAHWLCDVLPRLILLIKSGVLEQVDKILLNYSELDFQKETLAILGIPKEKILNCVDEIKFHLQADRLFVPSYPNAHGTVNPWVCREVKILFNSSEINSNHHKSPKRIYISRERALGRRMLNESEVFSFLEKEYKFVKVFSEDFSISEKAIIFSNAEIIVAPHGGGLTNIVFCSDGCKVVDIFPPGDFDTYFWSISNSNKLKYYYLFGEGEIPAKENQFMKRNANIRVDLNRLKETMELVEKT